MFAVNHPGYSRNKEEVKNLFIKNMKELVSYAEELKQEIILEPVTPYEGTIVCNSDDLVWALQEIKSDYFHAMLDLACPLTNGEPISDYFEKIGLDKLVHIHFIDAHKDSENHLIPGDGEIDFPNVVRYLKKIGYQGHLSLELFSMYENEPEFSAIKGIERIKYYLNNY